VSVPGSDQLIVPLLGIEGRAWRAPAQGLQAAYDIMGRIIHPTLHQNQRPEPTERPTIRVKPGIQRPVLEPGQHLVPWSSPQPRRPTRNTPVFQTPNVAMVLGQALDPAADRHATNAQLSCNVGLGGLVSLQEPPRFEATCFTLCTREVVRSPYHGSLLYSTLAILPGSPVAGKWQPNDSFPGGA
jgi:hypothetical protein